MKWTGRRAETARPFVNSGAVMSSFLTLDSVALATPSGRSLFSGLSLNLGRECVAVVGRNGAGKSTLLRAVLGEIAPQAGTIAVHGTVGMLEQVVEPGGETAAEALGVAAALARLERIEAGAAPNAISPRPTGRCRTGWKARWPPPACRRSISPARWPASAAGSGRASPSPAC
jgi:hypothetical protein